MKRSPTYYSPEQSVYENHPHQHPSEHLSFDTSQFQSPNTQTPFLHQEGPINDVISEHQKRQVDPGLQETINFDDAPEIIYGVAVRTRRVTPCERLELRCEELINEGKFVNCAQPRFR